MKRILVRRIQAPLLAGVKNMGTQVDPHYGRIAGSMVISITD